MYNMIKDDITPNLLGIKKSIDSMPDYEKFRTLERIYKIIEMHEQRIENETRNN